MQDSKFDSQALSDILMKLNGQVEPVGETNADNRRLENLIRLEEVLDILLEEVADVCHYVNRAEWSMNYAGKNAITWLKDKREWLDDFLDSNEEDSTNAM